MIDIKIIINRIDRVTKNRVLLICGNCCLTRRLIINDSKHTD